MMKSNVTPQKYFSPFFFWLFSIIQLPTNKAISLKQTSFIGLRSGVYFYAFSLLTMPLEAFEYCTYIHKETVLLLRLSISSASFQYLSLCLMQEIELTHGIF